MEKSARIYVAGHRGLVGSAICRVLEAQGYTHIIKRSHQELDLMDALSVREFFDKEQPEYVFLAAAFVGGIMANNRYRADFIYNNLSIQQNVLGESYRHGVKKLLFLGSTCIYPRDAAQPITEDALLTAPLEYTNEPYAIAKIAGLKMCESFNIQYGCDYLAVMPTNLYGPGDNFHLENSHVLPGIMRKIHLTQLLQKRDLQALKKDLTLRPIGHFRPEKASINEFVHLLAPFGISPDGVTLWGTGQPLREFMWSDDMAEAAVYVLQHLTFQDLVPKDGSPIRNCHINVGTGVEHSIAEVALLVAQAIGYEGTISFDASYPDGTMRKLTDPSRLRNLGWKYTVSLEEGILRLYQWYLSNNNKPIIYV